MSSTVRPAPLSVLLALAAALLAPPPVAGAPIDFRAVVGLPRASSGANGQVIAWRTMGVRAESDWIDAQIQVPMCVPVTPRPLARDDDSGVACPRPFDTVSSLNLGGPQTSITVKLPQWDDRAPWIDVSVRQWRSAWVEGSRSTRQGGGTAATVVLTQPLAAFDALIGYEAPLKATGYSGRWRALFAGLAWRSPTGVALELIGERATERATADVDRTLVLRLWRRLDGSGARIAAWTMRSFDDPRSAWRLGLGFEIVY